MSEGFTDPDSEKKLKAAQLLLDKLYAWTKELEKKNLQLQTENKSLSQNLNFLQS